MRNTRIVGTKASVIALVIAGILSGCGGKAPGDEEYKVILECSMASKLVGQMASIDIVANEANRIAAKKGYSLEPSRMMEMHDEIKAKWSLKSMNRAGQDELLVNVYNSEACVNLHRSPRITVGDVPVDS